MRNYILFIFYSPGAQRPARVCPACPGPGERRSPRSSRTKLQDESVPLRAAFGPVGDSCSPVFVRMTKAPLSPRPVTANPRHCTWKQKHLTHSLQTAGDRGTHVPCGATAAAPLALCVAFLLGPSIITPKNPSTLTDTAPKQGRGGSNPPAPRLSETRQLRRLLGAEPSPAARQRVLASVPPLSALP